ncbi:MAG: dTDP-4-dehydrorhamnose reductase [Candidatus Omnitrophota bacterium]
MPQEEKRKILVIGSSGMLGVDLCKELSKTHDVFGLDLSGTSDILRHRSHFVEGDITVREAVESVILELRPSVVFHTAAWTDVDGCERDPKTAFRVNADGTENVARCCDEAGSSLVYISTDYVFDGSSDRPYREDDVTNPLGIYGRSKLRGEDAVKRLAKDFYIVRTSWLFGANGGHFVDAIIRKAGSTRRLTVVDDQRGSPTYTKDLAKALSLLLEKITEGKAARGAYHIANSGNVSWCDYARAVVRLKRLDAEVVPISTVELNRPAPRPKYSVLDTEKFYSLTKHRLRAWEEALRTYLETDGKEREEQ